MKNKLFKYISYVLMLISIIYLVQSISKLNVNWAILKNADVIVSLLMCILVLSICLFLTGYVYRKNYEIFSGESVSAIIIFIIYLKANIGKYIPGNIMHFAERNILGKEYHLNQSYLLGSTILLHVYTISVSLLLPIIFYKQFIPPVIHLLKEEFGEIYLFGLILLLIVCIIMSIIFRKKIFNTIGELIINIQQDFFKVFVNLILVFSYLVFYGGSFLIIIKQLSINLINMNSALYIIISFIIAWVIGLLVVGAPGGIGVREAVLLLLLQNIFLKEDIIIIVILHRLSSIFTDFLGYVVVSIIELMRRRRQWNLKRSV